MRNTNTILTDLTNYVLPVQNCFTNCCDKQINLNAMKCSTHWPPQHSSSSKEISTYSVMICFPHGLQ